MPRDGGMARSSSTLSGRISEEDNRGATAGRLQPLDSTGAAPRRMLPGNQDQGAENAIARELRRIFITQEGRFNNGLVSNVLEIDRIQDDVGYMAGLILEFREIRTSDDYVLAIRKIQIISNAVQSPIGEKRT